MPIEAPKAHLYHSIKLEAASNKLGHGGRKSTNFSCMWVGERTAHLWERLIWPSLASFVPLMVNLCSGLVAWVPRDVAWR